MPAASTESLVAVDRPLATDCRVNSLDMYVSFLQLFNGRHRGGRGTYTPPCDRTYTKSEQSVGPLTGLLLRVRAFGRSFTSRLSGLHPPTRLVATLGLVFDKLKTCPAEDDAAAGGPSRRYLVRQWSEAAIPDTDGQQRSEPHMVRVARHDLPSTAVHKRHKAGKLGRAQS